VPNAGRGECIALLSGFLCGLTVPLRACCLCLLIGREGLSLLPHVLPFVSYRWRAAAVCTCNHALLLLMMMMMMTFW